MNMAEAEAIRSIHFEKWNRKTLNAYWIVVLISVVAELVGAFFVWRLDSRPLGLYFLETLLLPSSLAAATVLVSEWVNKHLPAWSIYLLITAGTLIAAIFVTIQPKIDGLQMTFVIPMLVSVYYFQWRKLMFSFVVNLVALCLILLLDPEYSADVDWREVVSAVTLMTCGVVLAYGIMSRGAEIQQYWVRTTQEQQELLVRNALMEQLSKTDALTGLYNHKTFHEYLDRLVEQGEKHGLKLQLAIMDIDNFKTINDTYGHWVGDLVLNRVAQTIKSSLTCDDFAARYGGEEFVVIFADKTEDEAFGTVELIRNAVSRYDHEELGRQPVTISAGLRGHVPGIGKERLFKGADEALYDAKLAGKNRTVVYRSSAE
ncbi:GGDEF domain-containing protein [Paenibacillus hemerocallicola]|uniref:GGDEF domain-containing protein n=1 Tax=Paenibacillus hemerocallicola TaxID=1172614 RepID=A0A5C4TGC9_9BACL|nr:GGDEF domain-containing protein [Paenibacillus hemerocallicola]TNJ67560.1 GGDEF domain-containing protein [Paenibacillus hemerocallicola]